MWTWWAPTSTTGTAAPATLTRIPPQPALAHFQHGGYQLILGVPLVPLTVSSSASPPEPGHPYQLADYPDVLAAFRQGVSGRR